MLLLMFASLVRTGFKWSYLIYCCLHSFRQPNSNSTRIEHQLMFLSAPLNIGQCVLECPQRTFVGVDQELIVTSSITTFADCIDKQLT